MSNKHRTPFARPRLVVSECLGFRACRYNGDIIRDQFTDKLAQYADMQVICPEEAIGLGTPRPSIRLVSHGEHLSLEQPQTGQEFSQQMRVFSREYLRKLAYVPEGFLLKDRSPSCGIYNVKVHHGSGPQFKGKASGVFGSLVLEHYPDHPVETEGRLRNFSLREQFLTAIFTLARYRELEDIMLENPRSIAPLVDFHSDCKYLLMANHQGLLRKMGRLVANHDHHEPAAVYVTYGEMLRRALHRPVRIGQQINVLLHLFGYFSNQMVAAEKAHFLDCIERLRNGQIPLSVPMEILRISALRHDHQYLQRQLIFDPYPEELRDISDSGKGRDR